MFFFFSYRTNNDYKCVKISSIYKIQRLLLHITPAALLRRCWSEPSSSEEMECIVIYLLHKTAILKSTVDLFDKIVFYFGS